MTDNKPTIVFMGTPEFAVASLRALHEGGYTIAAVVTAPDKPAGRGRKITRTPVKEYALENGLPLLQPEKLRDTAFLKNISELNTDMFVVVAFRMLPPEVWSMPPLGTFNLHASLLPLYRGAAPINHAIINGETRTGVTTFLIDNDIDTGKILLKKETDILPEDNAGTLHDRLMLLGADLVKETVIGLTRKNLKPVKQIVEAGSNPPRAPKIFPSDTVINWNDTAVRVHNKIRGLSPWPGAVTTLVSEKKTVRIKLFESRIAEASGPVPGTIITGEKTKLIISCRSGAVEILSLQPEGRKRMTSSEFLRGYDLRGWTIA
ncbi:MAG: methionyl-tRNA formyltransferase [Bacteroidales bacterium]|nr:methionyl-tRNA formyltransferase [Bacteroidales bacterium]